MTKRLNWIDPGKNQREKGLKIDRGKRYEFGKWLKSIRIEKGLSQHKASKLLGYRSNGTINAIEQGIGILPVEKIHPLSKAYGLDIAELLNKMKGFEPDLYLKYMTLEQDIINNFTRQIRSYGTATLTAMGAKALHHNPFPENGRMSDNVTYVNNRTRHILYIMSTNISDSRPVQSTFQFPDNTDKNQIPLFAEVVNDPDTRRETVLH